VKAAALLVCLALLPACATTQGEPFCLTVVNGSVSSINFKGSREQMRTFDRNRDRGALFPPQGRHGVTTVGGGQP
jgi:hypothetical protein